MPTKSKEASVGREDGRDLACSLESQLFSGKQLQTKIEKVRGFKLRPTRHGTRNVGPANKFKQEYK